MAREKKSMIGFDPLAWLDESAEKKFEKDTRLQKNKSKKGESQKSKKVENKKNNAGKPAKNMVNVFGRDIDRTALLKGYDLFEKVSQEVVEALYSEMLLKQPEYQSLFEKADVDGYVDKMSLVLKFVIENIFDEPALKVKIEEMAKNYQLNNLQHKCLQEKNALPGQLKITSKILVTICKEKAGRSWTKAVSSAWLDMLLGMADVIGVVCKEVSLESQSAEVGAAVMSEEISKNNITENNITENNITMDDESMNDENLEPGHPVLQLNHIQDISKSQALKNDMLKLINDNDEIDIDASEVERIDGSALQLLCALFSYAHQNDLVINWIKPSDSFIQSVNILGMQKILDLV